MHDQRTCQMRHIGASARSAQGMRSTTMLGRMVMIAAGLLGIGCLALEASPERQQQRPAVDPADEQMPRDQAADAQPGGAAGASSASVAPTAAGSPGVDAPLSAGGAVAVGGAGGMAGTGGVSDGGALASICVAKDGAPMPYDHSRGLAGEYAFELAMSCELGGYLAPVIEEDPMGLSGVDAFTATLTDWLRHRVLICADASPPDPDSVFLLLPAGAADRISRGDFQSSIALFVRVLDRHDELQDGLTPAIKQELRRRLTALADDAVKQSTDSLTSPSPDPACMPAPGAGGAAGATSE